MNLPAIRAAFAAMTRRRDPGPLSTAQPLHRPRMARELHRGELKFWHLGAIQQKAEREAREAERRHLQDLISRHVRSDDEPG
jgi:hypothetical protein